MLGIRYHKASPTSYVLHYVGGRLAREGAGLSFPYFAPLSTVVAVPLESADDPFVFTEVTADFQEVTVQGVVSYRVSDPKRLAGLLDYRLGPGGGYASEDPEKLGPRLVQAAQVRARDFLQKRGLREALAAAEPLGAALRAGLPEDEAVRMLGVEVLGVSVLALRPTPEMAKALEAEARERLKREADDAVYERRNAAVEQERRLKESELGTELAVEVKRREIRERKMAADIAVEEQRASLVERQAANDRKAADGRAYALTATLGPLKGADWRVLLAAATGAVDPRLMIASAFGDLAGSAGKIGELNISPDLLRSLLREDKKP